MIDTPEVREARRDLQQAIMDWADNTPWDRHSSHFAIVQLRIDLLAVAVENAARVAQITEDYQRRMK